MRREGRGRVLEEENRGEREEREDKRRRTGERGKRGEWEERREGREGGQEEENRGEREEREDRRRTERGSEVTYDHIDDGADGPHLGRPGVISGREVLSVVLVRSDDRQSGILATQTQAYM